MVMQLLPASAAAFAPRAPPTIVLNGKVETWLKTALKGINKTKRPLHNPSQVFKFLTETLGGEAAIWTLTTLMLPKAPEAELRKDDNPLMEAINNYDMLHVKAYVVHIDMVSQHEIAFKLMPETIDALVEYHRDIWSVDASASSFDWPEKDSQLKKLQQEFVQAANRFVFRTDVRALEDGLEDEGAGELIQGRPEHVKNALLNLFTPLLAPPPRIVDVVHPAPAFPRSNSMGGWWHPNNSMISLQPPMMDSWRVLPSTPSPTITSCSDPQYQSWPLPTMNFDTAQLPSPTPSYTQPAYTTSASLYNSPQAMAPIPMMMYPSQLPQSCGTSMTGHQFDVYGFGGYNSFATPQYAATM